MDEIARHDSSFRICVGVSEERYRINNLYSTTTTQIATPMGLIFCKPDDLSIKFRFDAHGVALASTNANTAPALAKMISRPLIDGEPVDAGRVFGPIRIS